MCQQKCKWLSKYCRWKWLSWGEWMQNWVQSAAVNKLCCAVLSTSTMSEEHWSEFQPSVYIGTDYCPLCSWSVSLKSNSWHVLLKRRKISLCQCRTSCYLVTTPPLHTPTWACSGISYIALEKGYYISGLLPQCFYFSAHYRKGS